MERTDFITNLYERLCALEKRYYEDIYTENNFVFLKSENEPIKKYSSYKNLFDSEFKNSFLKHLDSVGSERICRFLEIEKSKLQDLIEIDEKDLDGDGTPDRIDYDKNRNTLQTVADTNLVNNSYRKEHERTRDNDERER